MTKQNKQDLKLIIDYYGKLAQLTMCIEEMSELTKELCKYHRGSYYRNSILEEVTDVLITIEQLKIIFELKEVEIQRVIDNKIDRTLKRMEK